jgi:hypothetical protein
VWAFQLWNEPNLASYLTPQWVGNQLTAPVVYRHMLNAFYAGIKSVAPSALVVTAGTAPFGNPGPAGGPDGQRIMPALFWRTVLCEREDGAQLTRASCPDPAHFDVLAHHPYSVGAPDTPALNADDVSIPDIGKLTRILRAAERFGTALPRIHHQIWVTETGYNTKPPNPNGIPVAEDARWLEQTLELLWSQGVSLITWDLIVDQAPNPSYSTTTQSGIFFINGRPKRAWTAFSFPLVALRKDGAIEVWGRAPVSGRVVIQQLRGGAWRNARAFNVHMHATFLTRLVDTSEQPVTLRARVDGQTSLPWPLS